MSDIVAVIIIKTIIDWTTVSITSPVPSYCGPSCVHTVMRYDTCNQIGQEYEVTIAQFEWNGATKEVELGRRAVNSSQELKQSVICDNRSILWQ